MFPKTERAQLGYGHTAGKFHNITKTPKARDKQYLLPHLTVNVSGQVSIVNSFFISQGINPNTIAVVQFDPDLAMLRFKLDRHVDPLGPHVPVTSGILRLTRNAATQVVSTALQAMNQTSTLRKCVFVICRIDYEGWYYAKASGYRFSMQLPRWWPRLDQSEIALWNMPHNVK